MRAVLENTFGENDADITAAATSLHSTSRGGAEDLGKRLGPLAPISGSDARTPLAQGALIQGYKTS
jgi:hypothetical protein